MGTASGQKDQILAAVLKKNPRFINEPVYAKRLEDEADKIVERYAVGRLIVAGDNRYLSGDLLDFVSATVCLLRKPKQGCFKANTVMTEFRWALELTIRISLLQVRLTNRSCLHAAAQSAHCPERKRCSFILYDEGRVKIICDQYLGHLTDVVMVGYTSLAAERLGGADYDGDMIKTISDPI